MLTTSLDEVTILPFPDAELDSTPILLKDSSIPPAESAGGVVVPDVYETYLNELGPGETPEELTVAKESHSLRLIMMLVDTKDIIKAVIDPGSQIIAMSDTVCHDLGLAYNPLIRLNMQ